METVRPVFQKYLFVCENERADGRACCASQGARLREILKEKIKAKSLGGLVRVSRSGCLDTCEEGPNILLMPDAVWFKRVTENDLDEIVRRAEK